MADDRDILGTAGILGDVAANDTALETNAAIIALHYDVNAVGAWDLGFFSSYFPPGFSDNHRTLQELMKEVLDEGKKFFADGESQAKDDFLTRAQCIEYLDESLLDILLKLSATYLETGTFPADQAALAYSLFNKLSVAVVVQKKLLALWVDVFKVGVVGVIGGLLGLHADRMMKLHDKRTAELLDEIEKTKLALRDAGQDILEVALQAGLNQYIGTITVMAFAVNPLTGVIVGVFAIAMSIKADEVLGPKTSSAHTWSSKIATGAGQIDTMTKEASKSIDNVRTLPPVFGKLASVVGKALDAKEGAEAIETAKKVKGQLDALQARMVKYTEEWDALLPTIKKCFETSKEVGQLLKETATMIDKELESVRAVEREFKGKLYVVE